MSLDDIYSHYHIYTDKDNKILTKPFTKSVQKRLNKEKDETNDYCMKYITKTIDNQKLLIEKVWKMKNESKVYFPVAFKFIIQNIQNQCNLSGNSLVDVSPLETFKKIYPFVIRFEILCRLNSEFWLMN